MHYSGRLIISLSSHGVQDNEIPVLQHPLTLGIILFACNYKDKEQLTRLIGQIQHYAQRDIPIFVDHEGGRVQRLTKGFTMLPLAEVYSIAYDNHPETGLKLARHYGAVAGKELQELGIIPLGPVLDVYQGNSALKGRSFHHTAEGCTALTTAFIEGMGEHGIPATGKHFPDHGKDIGDSHHTMPKDDRPYDEITGIQVYKTLLPKLAAIMPAHIIYPKIAPEIVYRSSKWQQILREELGFTGVTVSDCLSMKGAGEATSLQKVKDTLTYMDVALLCHLEPKEYMEVLDGISDLKAEASQGRVANWVTSTAKSRETLQKAYRPITAKTAVGLFS